jgi:DNA-binding Lrp family transcriptional regulator
MNKEDLNMVSALVLVNTDLGVEDKVLESLKGIEGVEEAHSLCGVYDLVVKVKAMFIDKLKDIIKFGIRQTIGVASSITLLLVEQPTKHQN